MNIVVVGSLGYDYIMNYPGSFTDRIMEDKIHSLSLSFLVDDLTKQFGGTAGNIAYTLNLLKHTPYILAYGGNDFEPYLQFLKKNNIETRFIAIDKKKTTSSYFVVTDHQNNQIGSFYMGPMKQAARLSLHLLKKNLEFVIIAPTEPKAMIKAVQECIDASCPYLFDPAFQIATFTEEDLLRGIKHSAILIGNDYEIELIQQKLSLSHDQLISLVPILVTTLGNKGSIIETNTQSIHIRPAKPKAVIDPTGAGDAYRAGFLSGYFRGFPLDICGKMGSVAAVYTVELFGTMTHTFSKRQFIQRYEENYGDRLKL